MRIIIDMQGAQTASRFRGIGRYTMGFAMGIVRNRCEHEVILALSGLFPETIEPIRAAFAGMLPQENIRVWYAPGPVCESQPSNNARREVAEFVRESFLASLQPDIIHITSLFEGYIDDAVTSIGRFDTKTPISVTLYDLIPLLNPDQYLKQVPSYEAHYKRKLEYLKRASIYLAISDSARQEGIEALNPSDESVFVNVSTAAEAHFKPEAVDEHKASGLRNKFGLNAEFVLYFGGSDERKNVPRLIEAFASLPIEHRERFQLLIAGGLDITHEAQFREVIKRNAIKEHEVCFTGRISDDELVQLYNLCHLFIFPSWHEGFGLPALEAMSCGAPVLGANASSMPEVIGNEEALFDPFDVASISKKIEQYMNDDALRDNLQSHGLSQAKRFSWQNTAKRAVFTWEKLAKNSHKEYTANSSGGEYRRLIASIAEQISSADKQIMVDLSYCIAHNERSARNHQLLLDVSELVQHDAKTGIQRVVRSILMQWLSDLPYNWRIEPVYASMERDGYYYARKFTNSMFGYTGDGVVDEPVEAISGDVFLGLDLQPQIVPRQINVLKKWHESGVAVQFVVYDMLPVLIPECFPHGAKEGFVHWLEAVTQFDGAVCISKAVADELRAWLAAVGLKRDRPFEVRWFHLGGNTENSVPSIGIPTDAPQVLATLRARPSFLCVGTIEPRKGHAQTLEAFEALWADGFDTNLVFVGKQGWNVDGLIERLRGHREIGKRLFWLEAISDEYLDAVYSASNCLIAGSEGEGFGLPLIEAAHHKLPIIARDLPVFREVAREHALYFENTKDAKVLANAVIQWLKMDADGNAPQSDMMPWLTWEQSAQQLIDLVTGKQNISQNATNKD